MVIEPPPWLGAAQSWPRAPRDGDDVAVPPRCLLRSAPGAAARATHAFLGVRSLAALLETSKSTRRRAAALVRDGSLWYALVRAALAPHDGAEATLGRTERVVVEVHDIDGRLGECTELLEARGFQTLTQRAPGCMPENHLLFGFRTLPQAIRERLDDEAR